MIDFDLTDTGGNRVRALDLRGCWLLIFFGYTLCPTTLSEIAGALAQLGPLAAQVQPVFVSIVSRGIVGSNANQPGRASP